ncbi:MULTISPECIES: zinc-dependent alcohol dehydrogenase family protein [Methylosinus]|uniref:NADPH:quinone reductase n=1 Tax=Methylosinus trichosporium (strain ATCC 35070 / NCIMB 11131 / UNIQEM 75 / OB3b) TaxID=595536 RepID=A0A2D2D2D9_METT3|nr:MULTISPECIES: zinc-dependent alcohol dehydrogenase family protein [Methylosinus]ATQ69134.1 NADPH:quinone reductase [Methylosinus trichosporium OB3b]OBS53558.1 NADPH:quinone reductase [Methylosinus sp. 3S-1]
MTRIVRFHRLGGPDALQIDELDIGAPKAGEIRIRVRAIGLNRAEAMFRSGGYIEAPRLPSLLGYEASGEIEAIGEGVTGFAIGDAVSTMPAFSMTEYGVYGEAAIVPAHAVVRHPSFLSWSEAAAIWMQYLTAYGALVEIGGVGKGDAVVITAASSSVGLAAIQIANAAGATSIAVTRTRAKREALEAAGAQHVIVTESDDLVAETLRITRGDGARLVFDPIGGPGVDALAEAAASGGIIFLYGALASAPTPFPLFTAIRKQLSLRGYTLFSVTRDPSKRERGVRFVLDGLAKGSLRPIIARSFAFERIVEAHRFLESNEQVGKIVVTV